MSRSKLSLTILCAFLAFGLFFAWNSSPQTTHCRSAYAHHDRDQHTMDLTGLFRTSVTHPTTTGRDRLEALDVLILEESEGGVLVMATAVQLETLARLRFNPIASDDLGNLVNGRAGTNSWLADSLQSMLNQTTALWQEVEQLERSRWNLSQNRPGESGVTTQALREIETTLTTLHNDLLSNLHTVTAEQQMAIANLTSIDSDSDGLTDTEEYCPSAESNKANKRFL